MHAITQSHKRIMNHDRAKERKRRNLSLSAVAAEDLIGW